MQRNVNKANINIDLVFISQMALLTHCAPAAAAAAAASYYKFHSQKHTAKNKHRAGVGEIERSTRGQQAMSKFVDCGLHWVVFGACGVEAGRRAGPSSRRDVIILLKNAQAGGGSDVSVNLAKVTNTATA